MFQDKRIIQVIEAVFADYSDVAIWQCTDDVTGFLSNARPHSFCLKHGESHYALSEVRLVGETPSAPTAPVRPMRALLEQVQQ